MHRNLCTCPACGLVFANVDDFDGHRTGSYDQPGQRRCLDASELLERFTSSSGIWRLVRRSPAVATAIAS